MGPEPAVLAVVDQDGRMHGPTGLRVMDASILPDCQRPKHYGPTRGDQLPEAEVVDQQNTFLLPSLLHNAWVW